MAGRRHSQLPTIILLSGLLHLTVLVALGVVAPRPEFRVVPEMSAIDVTLITRDWQANIPASRTTKLPERKVRPNPLLDLTPKASSVPSNPSANAAPSKIAAPGETAAPARASQGPALASDALSGVRTLLRATVGCNTATIHLTEDERDACAKRFGDGARTASSFSGVPVEKRAAYDAALDAEQERRDGGKAQAALKDLQNARGGTGRATSVDINVGFNCGLKFGAGEHSLECKGAAPPPR